MKAEMRSVMQAAGRVQLFNQAHPVTDPGLAPVVGHLDERVARANALIGQQTENRERSKAAHQARVAVRKRLLDGLLRLFVGFFELAEDEVPELNGLRAPRLRAPDPEFTLAAARLIDTANTHLEALGRFGLTAALITEATELLGQFREISVAAKETYLARIQASQALDDIQADIVKAIQRLDRLNRHRFADQPGVLGEWEAARHILARGRGTGTGTGTEGSNPPSGPGGDARAAA